MGSPSSRKSVMWANLFVNSPGFPDKMSGLFDQCADRLSSLEFDDALCKYNGCDGCLDFKLWFGDCRMSLSVFPDDPAAVFTICRGGKPLMADKMELNELVETAASVLPVRSSD